jgi:flagellar basal-body rod modification protein FlgD
MSILPLSSTAALSSSPFDSAATTGTAGASSTGTSTTGASQQSQNLASQNVFLQLLVAQLKNQDPSQPTDGTQFVTELAQFTTLQEDTESATDLDTLVSDFGTMMSAGATPTTSTGTANAAAINGLNQPNTSAL